MKFGVERQSARRAMISLCCLACTALLVVFYAIDQQWFSKGVIMGAFLVATLGVIAGMIWISHATREYAIDTYGRETTDERQIHVRDAAFRLSYIIFLISSLPPWFCWGSSTRIWLLPTASCPTSGCLRVIPNGGSR